MKKEEERSYALLFFIASILLIASFAWVAWDEFYTIRPWKKYQARFYELEVQKTRDKYNEALIAFQNPVIQKEYKDAQDKLNKAWEDFRESETQKKYKKTLADLLALDKNELSPLKFKAVVNRNELMEVAYLFGHDKSEEMRNKIKEMEAKNEKYAAEIENYEKEKAELQKRLDGFKSKVDMYTKQLETYTEETDRYRNIMAKTRSKRPELQVHQVHFEDINKADRCMSCHVGIDREESVSEEQPYANHPMREVYLGNHPPEKFGCVLCHDGQGRANMDVEMAHGEVAFWLKPMYRGKAAQSSCIKCHDKGVELAGGDVIWKGLRLFEELGCNGCHKAEGFGKDKYKMIGPDLTGISSKVSAGWLVEWLKDPKVFRPATRMPKFMFEEDEAKAISSYLWQNSSDADLPAKRDYREAQGEFDEEMIEEGAYIFESVGCLACHSDVADTEKTHGPNLARVGEKVNYEYLVSWLLAPKTHQPRTRMPDLRLDEEDARFLAAYLMSLRSEGREASTKEAGWLDDKELAGRGEKLISRYGCFGCHKIKGMEDMGKVGVELSVLGSKEVRFFDFGLLEKKILGEVGLKHSEENVWKARDAWIRAKLEDPRQYDEGRYRKPEEKLKMPNFGLNKDEVDALSILLSGLRGEELPEKYMAKLTEKERHLAEDKRIVDKYNCMGCHQFSIDRLYLEDGTEVNGMVKLEEGDSIFFQLWEDNEKLGKKAGETAQIKKGQIKNRIRSKGGDIAPFIIDYYVEAEGRVPEEAKVFTPPILYGEGKKVQFAWLFKFLKNPISLRPWLEVRMPTFNFQRNEAISVVRYFAAVDNEQYPYEFFKETDEGYIEKKEEETPGYLAKARNLFESKNVNCASCHVRGDIEPEGDPADWAPDLSRASKRLKPNWVVRWLLNPQLVQPGTKMPRFFREGSFQDIFPGMPEEQAESIKDLLMNFPQDMLISEEPDKSVKNELSNKIEKTKKS